MNDEIDMYDFDGECSQTYVEYCKQCGKGFEVSTQKDRHPEYYSDIFIRCESGTSVAFCLPMD